jgi:3-methyl-2-oxobutanoate hydroxymethyltransferase
MLGMFSDFTPKFVKRFADLSPLIRTAFAEYIADVRQGAFPGPEHCYGMDDAVLDKL